MAQVESSKLLESGKPSYYFLQKQNSLNLTKEDSADVDRELIESEVHREGSSSFFNWFKGLFRRPNTYEQIQEPKPRKVPVKVEPKVFFANERTFLAWLHMSVTLASISVAIVAFAEANEWSQLYGLMLLPVAIAFCCYSLWMYIKRSHMIRRRDPGPYEDNVGPVVLAVMLASAILVNFAVKLYDYAT